MKQLRRQLIDLLTIQAPSGQEHKVSNYLVPRLKKMMDKVGLDHYGNLLAEKVVGDGKGATVILSAHMDSVRDVRKGRKIIEKDGVFSVDKGVLGADDRAGIAIILAVLRNIDKTSFSGTIKVAFSREEEIGCVGAGKIDPRWYEDADLAIVVDRRGSRDIVTGCWQAFCSTAVGKFFEECGAMLNMDDWKACEGGISDATVFSEGGVNSVNLSAGYSNEHTEKETVNIKYMRDTVNLILQAFALVNQFAHTFGEVPEENEWVMGGGYRYSKYNTSTSTASYDDGYGWAEEILYEGVDTFGDVSVTLFDEFVSIYQTTTSETKETSSDVFLTREMFTEICNEFLKQEYGYSMDEVAKFLRGEKELIQKHKAVVGK